MRIQMNKILLFCALVMLSLEIVGGAKCQGCQDVRSDNKCMRKEFVCSRSRGYCFIRRFQTNGAISRVSRGCTWSCKTGVFTWKREDIFTWCCTSDNCNSMNAWF